MSIEKARNKFQKDTSKKFIPEKNSSNNLSKNNPYIRREWKWKVNFYDISNIKSVRFSNTFTNYVHKNDIGILFEIYNSLFNEETNWEDKILYSKKDSGYYKEVNLSKKTKVLSEVLKDKWNKNFEVETNDYNDQFKIIKLHLNENFFNPKYNEQVRIIRLYGILDYERNIKLILFDHFHFAIPSSDKINEYNKTIKMKITEKNCHGEKIFNKVENLNLYS